MAQMRCRYESWNKLKKRKKDICEQWWNWLYVVDEKDGGYVMRYLYRYIYHSGCEENETEKGITGSTWIGVQLSKNDFFNMKEINHLETCG